MVEGFLYIPVVAAPRRAIDLASNAAHEIYVEVPLVFAVASAAMIPALKALPKGERAENIRVYRPIRQ